MLEVEVAQLGERLAAFLIDMFIWFMVTVLIFIALILFVLTGVNAAISITLCLFLAFIVRNLYFTQFELAWQGSTPGKRMCGLRVIDREGGPLLPSAIVARNLTREVEIFLPLGLYMSLSTKMQGAALWQSLSYLAWVVVISGLPFFNRDRLRAGDLIAGTMVIALPRHALSRDLTEGGKAYRFTHQQLQAYGAFELQVLEELLRRPDSAETRRILGDVATKIRRKIGWTGPVTDAEAPSFLQAFYTAERAELERGQLFGHLREDKNSPV